MQTPHFIAALLASLLLISNLHAGMTIINHNEDDEGWITFKIYDDITGRFPGSCGNLAKTKPDFTQYVSWDKQATLPKAAPEEICLIMQYDDQTFATSPLSNTDGCILEIVDIQYRESSHARATQTCLYQNKCADGKYYYKEHDWRTPGSEDYKEAFANCYPTQCVEDPSLPFCLPAACLGDERCVEE